MKRWFIALSLVALAGCSLLPPINPGPTPTPTPTPEPPYTEECQVLLDEGMPWCHEAEMTCGDCVHNPSSNPKHCEKVQDCEEPPPPVLPEPQCPKFTDRGGTERCQSDACECYCEEVYIPCENEECAFPQGIANEHFTQVVNPGRYGSVVNRAMADLTGCAVGTDCPITFHPDKWMDMVCEVLCVGGLNCGRHNDTPPQATDQISVKEGSFCDGKLHENYQIFNYGGRKVRWAPGGKQDGWLVDCNEGPPPPIDPPPAGDCPAPHPDLTRMKFKNKESGNHMDTTWTTVNQEPFCAEIGMSPMGDGTPRGGCPVRPECGSDAEPDAICHDRAVCEAELCDQRWECNGQPVEGWRGNPAQTDCEGHYKTWCAAHGSTAVLEGNR